MTVGITYGQILNADADSHIVNVGHKILKIDLKKIENFQNLYVF